MSDILSFYFAIKYYIRKAKVKSGKSPDNTNVRKTSWNIVRCFSDFSIVWEKEKTIVIESEFSRCTYWKYVSTKSSKSDTIRNKKTVLKQRKNISVNLASRWYKISKIKFERRSIFRQLIGARGYLTRIYRSIFKTTTSLWQRLWESHCGDKRTTFRCRRDGFNARIAIICPISRWTRPLSANDQPDELSLRGVYAVCRADARFLLVHLSEKRKNRETRDCNRRQCLALVAARLVRPATVFLSFVQNVSDIL